MAQICGQSQEEKAAGYLKAEQAIYCLYHEVKLMMTLVDRETDAYEAAEYSC